MDNPKYRYHHIGIPTRLSRPDEIYLPQLKFYVCGYPNNDFSIEWMRFDEDCPLPKIVQELPHVAFVVDDLYDAIRNREVIIPPNSPSDNLLVAFILENDAPVELMQFFN